MVGSSPHQAESIGSQQQDDFLNFEWERDQERYQEGSVRTAHTNKSHSRGRSHMPQRQDNNIDMYQEIDDLKKKLRRAQRKQSPSSFDVSSNDEEDDSYKQRSRTLPSKSFSYDEERHHQRRYKNPSRKGVKNDVMSKVLNQISKIPFQAQHRRG